MKKQTQLLPTGPMARRLRVPIRWLRSEAEAGRLPHLKAGATTILFDPEIVEKLLLERARASYAQVDKYSETKGSR